MKWEPKDEKKRHNRHATLTTNNLANKTPATMSWETQQNENNTWWTTQPLRQLHATLTTMTKRTQRCPERHPSRRCSGTPKGRIWTACDQPKLVQDRRFTAIFHGGRHLHAKAVYLCASTPLSNALTTMTSLVKKLKKIERKMQNELNLTSNAYYTDVNGILRDVNKETA